MGALRRRSVSTEYTAATTNLRDLIAGVALIRKSLAAASDEASAAAKESTTMVDHIAQAVDKVAPGAQDQAGQIADTATAVEELSRTAEQIAKVAAHQAESIAQTTATLQKLDDGIGALSSQGATLTAAAREASAEAATGNAAVVETAGTIAQLKTVSTTAAGAMSSFEERSSHVEEIVDTLPLRPRASMNTDAASLSWPTKSASWLTLNGKRSLPPTRCGRRRIAGRPGARNARRRHARYGEHGERVDRG